MLQENIYREIAHTSAPMCIDDLPSPDTKRWVVKRKALVVAGVNAGIITEDEACERYDISHEEFASWRDLIEKHGIYGLRATRVQDYR